MTNIDYNSLSEEEQIKFIKNDFSIITHIKNPSKKVQLFTVNGMPFAINFIENPSEEVQLAVVNQNGYYIRYIENPTGKVKLTAIKNNGFAIKWIDNPTEEMQILSLEHLWYKNFYENCIKDLPNKTEWFYRELNRLKLTKGPLT